MFGISRRRHRQAHIHRTRMQELTAAKEAERKLEDGERRFKCIDERGNTVNTVGNRFGRDFEEVIDPHGHRFIETQVDHPLGVNQSDEAVMAMPVRVYAGDRDQYGTRDGADGKRIPRSKLILAGVFATLSEGWDFMDNDPVLKYGKDRPGQQLTFLCVTSTLTAEQSADCSAKRQAKEQAEYDANQIKFAQWDREEKAERARQASERKARRAARERSEASAGVSALVAHAA